MDMLTFARNLWGSAVDQVAKHPRYIGLIGLEASAILTMVTVFLSSGALDVVLSVAAAPLLAGGAFLFLAGPKAFRTEELEDGPDGE